MKSVIEPRPLDPEEQILYYTGLGGDYYNGKTLDNIRVTASLDGSPVMEVRNCRDGFTWVQELLVSGMVVGMVSESMFRDIDGPTTLSYEYTPDPLELMYPHQMQVFGPALEPWTWDAVEKVYPFYAATHRPKERLFPHVNVGTIGCIENPRKKADVTVTFTSRPGDPFYISDAEDRFYREWVNQVFR